jgi:spore maturation protein SpmA
MNRIFFWMIALAVATGAVFALAGDRIPPSVLAKVEQDWPEKSRDLLTEQRLATAGFDPGPVDGTLDDKTAAAVLAFQKAHGLGETGTVDKDTATALRGSDGGSFGSLVMGVVSFRLFDAVKATVVDIVIPLIGGMAFFLGVMKLAERSGLMVVVAKLLRPILVRLFPDVPPNHPAMSAMIMNISANALGLGNAATPFGLKAMAELDKLNPQKGTATNAMALFMAINTGSVTLLATNVMNQRAALGSKDPAAVIGTTLVATLFGTAAAIVSCKIAERFSPAPTGPIPDVELDTSEESYPMWASMLAFAGVIAFAAAAIVYGKAFSDWVVPLIVLGFASAAYWRGVPIYETFIEGAREAFDIAVRIIPYLAAILGVVGMLRGSGAIALFSSLVGPLTQPLGLPAEALPMVLLRPLSGSGASGVMMSIMKDHGPDSYVGYLVSTLQGSTETTFYVLAVYFGSVGVKNIRHSLIPGLTADLFGAIGAVIAVQAYFRMAGLSF